MQYPKNPQSVAHLLTTLATDQKNLEFICFCIESYFERLLSAPMKTLVHYGIRPVVGPMAAKLALRAIKIYSYHYSQMPPKQLKNEVGHHALQVHQLSKELAELLIEQPYKVAA